MEELQCLFANGGADVPEQLRPRFRDEIPVLIERFHRKVEVIRGYAPDGHFDPQRLIADIIRQWIKEACFKNVYEYYVQCMHERGKIPLTEEEFTTLTGAARIRKTAKPYERFLHLLREKITWESIVTDQGGKIRLRVRDITPQGYLVLEDPETKKAKSPADSNVTNYTLAQG